MSDVPLTPPQSGMQKTDPDPPESVWPKVIVSVATLLIYGLAHWIAWITKIGLDQMLGADGALAAAVVYYWVGSSAGSAAKTHIISKLPPNP